MEVNMAATMVKTSIKEYNIFRGGKSRDVYDLGSELLIVATDRISTFDVIMADAIPYKGKVLKEVALYWFNALQHVVPNHIITDDLDKFPAPLKKYSDDLECRSLLVKKAKPIMMECIVRGYLAGNGWKDYTKHGSIYGHDLPPGLVISEKLPEPIFTPSTKSETINGHDEYVTQQRAVDILGKELFNKLQDYSLKLYQEGYKIALEKGIIIADTKFEFGYFNDQIILIDEIFTPDSSRFWPVSTYKKGVPSYSLDKEFVRAYVIDNKLKDQQLATIQLPEPIIEETTKRYIEIYEILTEKKFDDLM